MNKEKVGDLKVKKPWPTKDAMAQIYKQNLWGGEDSEFYSGEGSHHPKMVNPYVIVLTKFLTSFQPFLVVCDLGCGDFNVGKNLVRHTKKYIAIDIVNDLIARNKEIFKHSNLEFHCLDIAADELPFADCVLIRQVLQHLSNSEVHEVVKKLPKFKYVILTEHVPEGDFVPNVDIISGQGTRLKKKSGLDLFAPPFNLKVLEEKQLLSIRLEDQKGVIITTLYKMF